MPFLQKNPLTLSLAAMLVSHVSAPILAVEKEETSDVSALPLPEIVVYADQNSALSSIWQVNREAMQKVPAADNNLTDYLKSNPHIRYENSDQNGFQRGEIKPQNISINGADTNQTAYFVDNVNINNDLGVDHSLYDGAMQVIPNISHTQGYFFDASMLSKVEVHDHNISAALGGFMGGAVVAKTRQYGGKDNVRLKYRTTQSAWAKLNADSSVQNILQQVRPDSDGTALLQPKYRKYSLNMTVEKGITENLGVVLGFSHRNSRIQQHRLIGFADAAQFDRQDHLRRSDNAFLNVNFTPNPQNRFDLGLRYSDYREEKYFAQNIDGNVQDYHQARGITLAWTHDTAYGVWTNTLAYDRFKDKRRSSSANVEIVSVLDENYEPLYDYEKGGYGNSELTQNNLHFSTEYALETVNWGSVAHSVSLGGIYQATDYRFHRGGDVHQTLTTVIDDMAIGNESVTPQGSAKTRYKNMAVYGEDLITWQQLEFRPGVRIERDDYLKNTNIAPRFVARYRPWEDTAFTLGLNRYYGRSFAALKLTEEILRINQDPTRYQISSHLKTPYADELSLGFDQNWQNLAFRFHYIHRKNKNRIILRKENRINYFKNGSDFNADIYSVQINNIEPWHWKKTDWHVSLGVDWLKTKRADLGRDYDPNEPVYLDGVYTTRRSMEQKINSGTEDWIARIGLDMSVPDYQLTWSNRIYIKSPIKSVHEINGDFHDDIARYRTIDYGRHTQWDSSVRWQPTLSGQHSVYVQLDILNVLNQVRKIRHHSISSNDEYGIYTAGREFWLELGYEF